MADILVIKVIGIPQVKSKIKSIDNKLDDWTPAFKKARTRYSKIVKDEFKNEGGMYGVPKWRDLSAIRQTIRGNAKPKLKPPAHPILQWTGVLKAVATSTVPISKDDPGKTGKQSPTVISYLSQDTKTQLYSELVGPKIIHQWGKSFPTRKLPARPFWPWGEPVFNEFMPVWKEYLDKLVS